MLKNNFKLAFRTLRRHPSYALLNIFGLALGLACCLLILLYVQDELSYDTFHEQADRIYRLEMEVPSQEGSTRWATTLFPVADNLRGSVRGIEQAVRVQREDQPLIARLDADTQFYEDHVLSTEPAFFDLFDFTLVMGNAEALAHPNTVIISESAAVKYFPGENPLGQHITKYNKWSGDSQEYEVVDVMEDMPHNVHARGDFLLSLATKLPKFESRIYQVVAYTYVLLRENESPAAVAAQFPEFAKNTFPERYQAAPLHLMPLTRIHLHGLADHDIEPQGDIRYVYLFSVIAVLMLLIACINYMNLSTARAARRAKEVGVRKVVGAERRQLAFQFLSESVLFTGLAMGLALLLVQAMLPAFNSLMGREMLLNLANGQVLLFLAGMALLVGLGAGSYPAFLLSTFRPAIVLKGAVRVRSLSAIRKGLVIFQFAVSVGLIICTIVIQQQLHFVQHTRLGFDKEQALIVRARTALADQGTAFRQALLQQSGVEAVGRGSGIPGEPTGITFFSEEDIEAYEGDTFVFDNFSIDAHFISSLGIEMAAGRGFSDVFPGDATGTILVNETAVRELGWEEPLGKAIQFRDGPRQVVGVVRDFHIADMRSEVSPMMLQLSPSVSRYYVVKFNTDNISDFLAAMEQTWERFVPEQPFDYSFLNDDFAAMYHSEQRLSRLFSLFATLTILIACLGLFGLAAFTTEQRTKEIGIRKVLGASVTGLVTLLSRDFLLLVTLAFVLAAPIAHIAMRSWLDEFAYRVDISWEIFAIAGVLALAITLLTVSYQAIKVALGDPVNSLRYE